MLRKKINTHIRGYTTLEKLNFCFKKLLKITKLVIEREKLKWRPVFEKKYSTMHNYISCILDVNEPEYCSNDKFNIIQSNVTRITYGFS